MKKFLIKLAIMLCIQIACILTVIAVGYAVAQASYYPFWGVENVNRILVVGVITALYWIPVFVTFKIKPLISDMHKLIYWSVYIVTTVLMISLYEHIFGLFT